MDIPEDDDFDHSEDHRVDCPHTHDRKLIDEEEMERERWEGLTPGEREEESAIAREQPKGWHSRTRGWNE